MNTHLPISPWLAVLLFILCMPFAAAQSRWSATPVDGEWSNPANWVDGVVPNGNTVSVEFGESTITQIYLSEPVTVKMLSFVAGSTSYVVRGQSLMIDRNESGSGVSFLVEEGVREITIENSIEIHNSIFTDGIFLADRIVVKNLSSLIIKGNISIRNECNLILDGSGAVEVAGPISVPGGDFYRLGELELNFNVKPSIHGTVYSMGNTGRINIRTDWNQTFAVGYQSGSSMHEGQIYLVKDGINTTSPFRYSGVGPNLLSAFNKADSLFGVDVPGSGVVTHSGSVLFQNLRTGTVGTTALYRLHTGEDDTFLISGVIQGNATGYTDPLFRKQGPGTAVFSAANTYTIPTEVAEGTLLVTGSLAATPVSVRSGATLGGTGALAGAVSVDSGAVLAPGSLESPTEVLRVASLTATGSWTADYDAAAQVPVDVVEVSGLLKLEGATLILSALSAAPLTELSYVIASYGNLEGAFGSVTGLPAGYSVDYAFGGNHIALVRTVTDAYTQWIDGFPEVTGPDRNQSADPDGDGLPNFHEFAFGSHPALAGSQQTLWARHGLLGGQPAFGGALALPTTLVLAANGNRLEGSTAGRRYVIEASADFVSWGGVAVTEISAPADQESFIEGLPVLSEGWSYRVFQTAAGPTAYLRARAYPSE